MHRADHFVQMSLGIFPNDFPVFLLYGRVGSLLAPLCLFASLIEAKVIRSVLLLSEGFVGG